MYTCGYYVWVCMFVYVLMCVVWLRLCVSVSPSPTNFDLPPSPPTPHFFSPSPPLYFRAAVAIGIDFSLLLVR